VSFWLVVAAVLLAFVIGFALFALFAGPLVRMVAHGIERKMRLPYRQNPMGLVPVAEKVTVLGIGETRIRAETGKPPSRPMGSPRHLSPWHELLLDFAGAARLATPDDETVSLAVTIGPRAKRPLKLSHPVLITAMSFGGALSLKARLALARAATAVDTATNSGEGVFIPEERALAKHYIIQVHRGTWPTSPQNRREVLDQADAIEVQVSQGAQGAAPMTTEAKVIHEEMRRRFGLKLGEPARIAARLQGVDRPRDLVRLLRGLKADYEVPVGLKLGASHRLEEDLAVALEAEVDFVTLDGAEGGTHGGPPVLQDDMGLPTLWAVARARRFLEREGVADKVSILAAGGLVEPGHFLKAIALGATACYAGTLVALALASPQMELPLLRFEPPYALDLQSNDLHRRLDVEKAARSVTNLLTALAKEFELALRALGHTRLSDLSRADLAALDPTLAQALGVAWVGDPLLGEAPRRALSAGAEEPATLPVH
jgi:glutamate synthase domain-containing protein 2